MGHGRLLGCTKVGAPCPRRILVGLCCGVALLSSSNRERRGVDDSRTGRRQSQRHRGGSLDPDHSLRGDGRRRVLQEPGRRRHVEPDRRGHPGRRVVDHYRDGDRPGDAAARVYASGGASGWPAASSAAPTRERAGRSRHSAPSVPSTSIPPLRRPSTPSATGYSSRPMRVRTGPRYGRVVTSPAWRSLPARSSTRSHVT